MVGNLGHTVKKVVSPFQLFYYESWKNFVDMISRSYYWAKFSKYSLSLSCLKHSSSIQFKDMHISESAYEFGQFDIP
jgi:hypothetical protein